jgi:anti-anti-sigma regulatory factor
VVVNLHDDTLLQDLSDLRRQLAEPLRTGQGEVVIDIGGVARLSSATVAAILWAKRSCATRGVDLSVRNPSGRNLDVLRRCGLAEVLCLRSAASRP